MSRFLFIILLLLLYFPMGYGQKSNNGKIPEIDIVSRLGTYRHVPMGEHISEVEYVPLETGRKFMIGRIKHSIITDTHIFVADFDYCYAFTRTGKFVSEIGRKGRGPGEWPNTLSGISVDEKNQLIYLDTYHAIFEYTWDGKFMRAIEKPTFGKGKDIVNILNVSFFHGNLFLGYINNRSGIEPHNWILIDDTGSIVKLFDNHIKLDKEQFTSTIFDPRIMLSGSTYVKEGINDTLFSLSRRNNELVPEFVFDLGKYAFPTDVHISFNNVLEIESKSALVQSAAYGPIVVPQNNVFFFILVGRKTGLPIPQGITEQSTFMGGAITADDSGTVSGMYNISNGKTVLLDRDPITRRRGLVNDIDGGLSFWPKYYNEFENELIDVWEAYDMKELLTEEYFAAHPAKDPAAHTRLRELLKSLKETDNPVIVIAKLKK